MRKDDEGMQIYELENQNEALSLRVADLERSLRDIAGFLSQSDLPYRVVSRKLAEISEKLDRGLSSYRI